MDASPLSVRHRLPFTIQTNVAELSVPAIAISITPFDVAATVSPTARRTDNTATAISLASSYEVTLRSRTVARRLEGAEPAAVNAYETTALLT